MDSCRWVRNVEPLGPHSTQFENIAVIQPPNCTDKTIDVKRKEPSDVRWLQCSRARTGVQAILSQRLSTAPLGFMAEWLSDCYTVHPSPVAVLQEEVV